LFGNFNPMSNMVMCVGGRYRIEATFIDHSLPDCVSSYNLRQATDQCSEGYERKVFDDFWMGKKTHFCAMCPSGTFWNNATRTCKQCIVGEYQDDHGMSTCETCPLGNSTSKTGSKSIKECYNQCLPGSYSSTGLDLPNEKCALCPKGTFSYLHGSTECTVCPGQSTTDKEGTALESECTESTKITGVLPGKKVSVRRNQEMRLACFFEGLPTPKAYWTKDGGDLPSNNRVEHLYDLDLNYNGISVIVSSMTTQDGGKYECNIVNSTGSDKQVVDVTVT